MTTYSVTVMVSLTVEADSEEDAYALAHDYTGVVESAPDSVEFCCIEDVEVSE